MKRVFGLVVAFACVSIMLVGCGESKEEKETNKTKELEAALKAAGEVYFNKYQKGAEGQDFNEVTLERMRNAAKYNSDFDVDLSKFENCDETTSVIIEADKNRNIVGYEYNIKC